MLPREHYLKQTFLDGVNFPDGFEKGGLSDIQARLIKKNGVLIKALTLDEVSDPSADDLHILKVIANQTVPKSPVEQAWMKYLSIVESRQGDAAPTKGKARSSKTAPITQNSIQQAILAATATRTAIIAAETPSKTASKVAKKTPTSVKKTVKEDSATDVRPQPITDNKKVAASTTTSKKATLPSEPKSAAKKVVKNQEAASTEKIEPKKSNAKNNDKIKDTLKETTKKGVAAPTSPSKKTPSKTTVKASSVKKTTPAKATPATKVADAKSKKAPTAKSPKASPSKTAEKPKKAAKTT